MARKCEITGKGPLVGHNVSHANNKTKRRFLPNIKETAIYSETLQQTVRVKVSAHGLRTIDKKGGIDAFVMSTAKTKLEPSMREHRARIEKARDAQQKAS